MANDIPSLAEAFGGNSSTAGGGDGLGMTTMPDDGGAGPKPGGDKDDWLELSEKPFSQFVEDNPDDLENAPDRERDKQELVFTPDDDEGFDDGDLDDFKDTRKDPDKKRMGRLQREMKHKHEAREQHAKLASHTDRIVKETTIAMRAEMKANQNLAKFIHDSTIDRVRRIDAELAQAKEEGNVGKIADLTTERVNSVKIVEQAKSQFDRYSDEAINAFVYDPKVPRDLMTPNGDGTSRGRDWMDANSEWFRNPDKFGAEIAAAKAIDQQLAREGKFDLNSDEYYMELTKRVAMRFRDLEVHTLDGRVARIGERQRGGGGGQRRDTTGSSSVRGSTQSRSPQRQGGKEVINSEERRMLERFGIDFSNKDHIQALKDERVRNK